MNLRKYQQIDILILTIIAIVCELVGYFANMRYSSAGFYLSFSIILCMIGMLRWGLWAFIIYPIAGFILVITAQYGQIIEKILLYPLANSFIILSALLFKKIKRPTIHLSAGRILIYVFVCYISVAIGKGFVLLLLGEDPIGGMIIYILSELFNILMVTLVMLFLRNRNGLMVDMYTYFEEEKESDI